MIKDLLIAQYNEIEDAKSKIGNIQNLSKKLTLKYGKGFSVSTIKDCR